MAAQSPRRRASRIRTAAYRRRLFARQTNPLASRERPIFRRRRGRWTRRTPVLFRRGSVVGGRGFVFHAVVSPGRSRYRRREARGAGRCFVARRRLASATLRLPGGARPSAEPRAAHWLRVGGANERAAIARVQPGKNGYRRQLASFERRRLRDGVHGRPAFDRRPQLHGPGNRPNRRRLSGRARIFPGGDRHNRLVARPSTRSSGRRQPRHRLVHHRAGAARRRLPDGARKRPHLPSIREQPLRGGEPATI